MNNKNPIQVTKRQFTVWDTVLLYKVNRVVDRKYITPSHSFMIYFEGPYDKVNTVALVKGNTTHTLPTWLASRIIELLLEGDSNGLGVEDALVYAAGVADMDGEVLVLIKE